MRTHPGRRTRFPPAADSPRHARRLLRQALDAAGIGEDDELFDTALLLAGELFDNAVLHAGTEFELELEITADDVWIAVSDRGAGPLELHLAQPRQRYGRKASHGRGLAMVQRLAASWGTRHDADGTHQIWFTLNRNEAADPPQDTSAVPRPQTPAAPAPPDLGRFWPNGDGMRRLLHLPATVGASLDAPELIAELVRRLHEVLDVDGVAVEVDTGDGSGTRQLCRQGLDPATDVPPARVLHVALPLTAPLRGRLQVVPRPGAAAALDIAELAAHRIALAIEADWLRAADRRRRAWMTYLADTSELLGQSLDVGLSVALVPQVVVPRLGQWSAVHLPDAAGHLQLAALTHADEDAIPELRDALDPGAALPAALRAQLTALLRGSVAPAWFSVPTDGIAVALTAAGRGVGVLTVGRPTDRPHSPEDIALITDIARRAALAIDNAQRTALHVQTSQAFQQALLPRALPTPDGVEFAAAYLPVSSGSDVGGDFYDVVPTAPDRWLASIGDVCGKGARAAARTGLVRDVLRVLVRDGRPLTRAIELLNDVMMEAGDPSQFCTLAAALISRVGPHDGGGLDVDLVLAGHLQPVVVRAGGATELIGRHGTAVGLVERVQLTCTRHHLDPGDMLLAYTDGVTERRNGHDEFGAERLLTAASGAAGRTAARLVASVRAAIEVFSVDERHDDIALLAVRAGPGQHSGGG
ncbi:SpoIIE family protein phosphatase [Pseudonocardia acidicola]|uniref:SpoIIE family protein phosphatase n=1 Tax=Pseudonocardia acidicola TaxID=2724939 RepID=A0ABX1S654_9PSEU|nr:SpoIIE family protein phosphatase [Pseudonocardia acidicola]